MNILLLEYYSVRMMYSSCGLYGTIDDLNCARQFMMTFNLAP